MTREEIIENLWWYNNQKNLDIGKSDITAIVDFVIENQEQLSFPERFDEAAKKELKRFQPISLGFTNGEPYGIYDDIQMLGMFKVGAEWMAGQGVTKEDTVDYLIVGHGSSAPGVEIIFFDDEFHAGDKVIVQIRKI